ncbi:MAG TPA: glycosyltransferase family 2 protein, partial [Patescibacteria group bacterium]
PTKLFKELDIQADKFDLEPEITCKVLKRGYNIYEVPITYVGRDFSEGKKITWRDGIDAAKVIFTLRLSL